MKSLSAVYQRIPKDWIAITMSLLSIGLVFTRMYYTHSYQFRFLFWNLFLAWLPWVFAQIAQSNIKPIRWGSWMVWLLFLPNSFYILTDLFHLKLHTHVPGWYDLFMLLSCAWAGVLWGFFSLRKFQQYLIQLLGVVPARILTFGVLFISSIGVYLGRYLRWNSWDVFTRPMGLLEELVRYTFWEGGWKEIVGFTLCMTGFLTLAYLAWVDKSREGLTDQGR
ncbi:MAG: DUF1361 domain-containing protein [Bacteroidota bacterium]